MNERAADASKSADHGAAREAMAGLRTSALSVQLATIDAAGEPHSSYTPFVFDDAPDGEGALAVFVSGLSLHTRDLLATRRCGAMLIADEATSSQIFARLRVTWQCRAELVARDSPRRDRLLDLMQARHGKLIGLLRTLGDFEMFRLVPESGMFVMGFGEAYRLAGAALDEFEHVTSA